MILKKTWIQGWVADIHEAIYVVQQLKGRKNQNKESENEFQSSYEQFMGK